MATAVRFAVLILVGLSIGISARAETPSTRPAVATATYTNPLGVDLADPDCIYSNGTYYCYGTSITTLGYKVWSSPDLVHWKDRGLAFAKTHESWGEDLFWAPCCVERAGKFYLYFSCRGEVADGKRSHRICVATADSPLGPFTEAKAPLFDLGKATIDAEAFIDPTDGKGYLYYALDYSENGESDLYVLPLGDDLISIAPGAKPTLCTKPSQKWEGKGWNEGPYVFKFEDTYVLMYSARVFSDPLYAVGFATSKSPLGPWTKSPENPILKRTNQVSGPGHNSLVKSPDGRELFIVYHTHKRLEGGHERELNIDRMTVSKDDKGVIHVKVKGPTRDPQPMPSGTENAKPVADSR